MTVPPAVRLELSGDQPLTEGKIRAPVLRRDAWYRRVLAGADVASAAAAVVLAVATLGDDVLTLSLLAALPMVVLVSKMIGLYDRDENLLHKTTLDEVPAIFQVATLYALLTKLLEGVFIQGQLGRTQLLVLWTLLFVLMTMGRAAGRWVVGLLAPAERCLVIGDMADAREIEWKLSASRPVKATVACQVALHDHDYNGSGHPILGDSSALAALLAEHEIHRVIVAPEVPDSDEILEVIRRVKTLGVKVSVLPRLFEVVGTSVDLDNVDGLTLLGVHRYGLTKSSEVLKRGMDLVGSVLGLLLLLPALVVIAAAIKLTSSGPVLFRQPRIGGGGRQFELLKFRTMVDGADALKPDLEEFNEAGHGFFKIAEDPRITRVGRILRRTCLDELPQLLNVVRGDMSLVGPRPLVPHEDAQIEGWQRGRLLLKPGMTGHWQIFGSSRIPLSEMVKIDYLYGANWSLWLDTKIILRTVPYILRRSGL